MSAPATSESRATVRSLLDAIAERQGGDNHLIDPVSGRIITYRESRDQVASIADAVTGLGIKPEQPVAYAFSNSLDGAQVILGLLYGGFLATAINLVAGANAIEYALQHSEAKLVITDAESEELVSSCIANHRNKSEIISVGQLLAMKSRPGASSGPVPGTGSLLMYTSGTTGRPKGVVHTQESLLCGGRNTAEAHQLGREDCGLCVLPFYHINAFCVSLMGSLVSEGTLVVPPKFSVSSFWDIIRENNCTWFSVVPTQISYLLHNADEPGGDGPGGDASGADHLRFGRSASAPLSPDVHDAFEKRFGVPIIETMGLTETAAQILSNPLPPGKRKIGSPGLPYGNEVIIADSNLAEAGRGEEGEILVRGPNVLREYLKNVEATAEAITSEGWLRTGDLGRMDEDGYVFVTGRLKEMIIKGGENIAPREIDDALYSHPDVIEAAAFGVACDNYGQRVEAGVKLRDSATIDADELLEFCRGKLGEFKLPDRIHLLPELPKGPSGKIQRIKLAEILTK